MTTKLYKVLLEDLYCNDDVEEIYSFTLEDSLSMLEDRNDRGVFYNTPYVWILETGVRVNGGELMVPAKNIRYFHTKTIDRPLQGNNFVMLKLDDESFVRLNAGKTLELDYREPEIEFCTTCCNWTKNGLHHSPHRHSVLDTSNMICSRCLKAMEERPFKDYYYKPDPVFYGKDEMFYGLEIEAMTANYDEDEIQESARAVTKSNSGFVYCKYDSSLRGEGFETVTHPITMSYEKTNSILEGVIDSLNDENMHSDYKAGIHIHTSKSSYTKGELAKIMDFFYRNKESIIKFSGRSGANEYCDFDKLSDRTIKRTVFGGRINDHHDAIAMSPTTVEYRIFASTLDYNVLLAFMEFVAAVKEYCNQGIWKLTNWGEFVNYVKDKDYPNLNKRIENM